MDDEDKQAMTVDDIALMREIVKWRRNHDVDFVRRRVYGVPYWVEYRTGRAVWLSRDEGRLDVVPGKGKGAFPVHVASLPQAVELLVAYGFLPPRFSSTYRAGWHTAAVWYGTWTNDIKQQTAERIRLFHDPANVSFPVGDDE